MYASHDFRIGDAVIFRISKRSGHPGPRAAHVSPEPNGEDYLYEVDKFWIVSECRDDGSIVLLTRRGKQHIIQGDNPRLRPAKWWERFVYRKRFPQLDEAMRLSVASSAH